MRSMEVSGRYAIAYKGLKPGRHGFRFEVDGSLFRAFQNPEIRDGACTADVVLTRGEAQLVCDVRIGGSVVVACDRCLDDCRVPIDFEGRLVVRISDEACSYDGETMGLLPGDEEVDLTQYIYESIVLSLPYQRVHPEDGCDPQMLERFRIVSDEEFASIEQRAGAQAAASEGPWAELAALRERMASDEPEDDGTQGKDKDSV